MSRRQVLLFALLASSASAAALAQDAPAPPETAAAPAAQSDDEYADDGVQEIVVQGQKPRGSVVGDIPPENTLTSRDIRATGATSISELIDSIASQTGSARGRGGERPILLLNGQRISGFRELRDLPPEAIERMEILPEEVALKYGYAADQRVVNIVLRRRFNSTSTELRGRGATDGGYVSGQGDVTRLIIADGTRTSFNFHADGNSPLLESERDIVLQPTAPDTDAVDPRPFRTLVAPGSDIRLSGTHNRTILGDVSATLNLEAERTASKSRFGVPTGTLDDGGTEIVRAFPDDARLTRTSHTDSLRLGTALNTQRGKWRLSSTGNAEFNHSITRTDNGADMSELQDRLDAGTLDPFGDLGAVAMLLRDRSRANRYNLTLDGTATGPLFALPAGDATATFRIGAGATGIDSQATRDLVESDSNLNRGTIEGSASIDLPITKRSAAIGRLSANANAEVTHLSDFGTLTSLGAGLTWAPAPRVNLTASWTREEGAPSLQQLGDPVLETPNVSFFDFTTGRTVQVTTVTGGNPDLRSDTRKLFKLGGNWQPLKETDLRLRAEYVHQTDDHPQASFPAASEALEAAFPGRFERDGDGNLVRVDLTPVNFEQSRKDMFRWGFDFTKPLKSKPPSQAAINSFRQRFAAERARQGDTAPPPPPPDGGSAGPGPGGGFRGFGGGGVGRFGGGQGGRLTLSLTHQINLVDEVEIAPGIARLDYLHGEPVGSTGGRARHEVQFETGYYNNGYGARFQGNWRSGTTVDSTAGDLKFSPYFDLDLRLFANLTENFDLVAKHPFFRGASVRLDIENILDNRPKVRDAAGNVPLSYQPDQLEPVGRTFGITFRKLFVPRRFFQQQRQRQPSN
ncbi:TonB-dependent receptor plug domain-containing protein [Sphingomonas sp.]|uniref:TonB-dependent receptor plug domain-containing protein n=1 Tax=Sphingomonas sp. TaxID=28214 RepID=UPI0025D0385E|nr:TonB-dependent receptor plug domain-containing protein [Sphingomonas sp.]